MVFRLPKHYLFAFLNINTRLHRHATYLSPANVVVNALSVFRILSVTNVHDSRWFNLLNLVIRASLIRRQIAAEGSQCRVARSTIDILAGRLHVEAIVGL